MADVRDFKPQLSSSRMFSKGNKDLGGGVVDDKYYNHMTASYETKEFLTDSAMFVYTAPLIYQLDLLKDDVDSIHQHLSESKFTDSKQKFPVVDVTKEFYVTGTTKLEGDTTIEGFTDIKGDFKVNGSTISNLKPALEFSDNLRAKSIVSSSAQIASDISGSFTSLSASIATDIGNAGGGTIDTTLQNGSTNAVTNNAVYDGLALKLNLAGGTMTGLVQEPFVLTDEATLLKAKGVYDARQTRVLQILGLLQSWTLTVATPAYRGQELTIIAAQTGTIVHTTPGKLTPAGSFVMANGKNLLVPGSTAVKFVANRLLYWIQIV